MSDTTVIKIMRPTVPRCHSAARTEAARLWNRMVRLHRWFRRRHRPWPSESQFKAHFKGRFALHSQTVQALVEKFFANIDSTRENRRHGRREMRYPWKTKKYFTVPWKGQAVRRKGNRLMLPMGRGRKPIRVRIPNNLPPGEIVQVEMGFRELNVTIKRASTSDVVGASMAGGVDDGVAALDPGIIHLAMVTDGDEALAVVGRGLRSIIQGHNKAKAEIFAKLDGCKRGSRRWRKLRRALARLKRQRQNRQRNCLHHAANAVVEWCERRGVATLVVGDITNINRGKKGKRSKRLNQENGHNPLGQFYAYLDYKLARIGARLVRACEAYTTQTCPACGHRHKPAGRVYRCTSKTCSFEAARDVVGASNLRNKHLNGGIIVAGMTIPSGITKYLRPVRLRGGVDPMTRGKLPYYHPPTDSTSLEEGAHVPGV
ncbi:MAG TPA: transposase [Gammaproteobacteria bacterium]|nr:transposase [Gammaproteobacteria bacterium]